MERFLPLALFISFFFPNTRLQPLASLMLPGRWLALAALIGLAVLFCINRPRPLPHLAPLPLALMLALLNIGVLLPFSVNISISMVKWAVFFAFLLFCYLFFSGINSREDALRVVNPLVDFFLVFIWSVPLGILLFPQWGSGWRSYFRNPNALGLYLAIFGVQAALFRLETARGTRQRLWALLHVSMATSFTIASGSRTSVFCVLLVVGIALVRFKDVGSRLSLPLKTLVFSLVLVIVPLKFDRFQKFIYKYPTTHSILESRTPYWSATRDAFVENFWYGAGFGVQSPFAEADLSYSSSNLAREQGSTYLGILEEVGLIGGLPLLLLFLVLALRFGKLLVKSPDPLQLLFARVVVAGLIWGFSEYFLLSLGNAISMLIFGSFFAHERLEQMAVASRKTQWRLEQWQHQQGQRPPGPQRPGPLRPVHLQPGES